MRYVIGILAIGLLAGCAGSAPKPPTVVGDYKPVNRTPPAIAGVFNLKFEGDISNSLLVLKKYQPQLNILPPVGEISPLFVTVNLQTNLENATRILNEQGGGFVEVVWNPTHYQGGNQIFLRYRSAKKQPTNQ